MDETDVYDAVLGYVNFSDGTPSTAFQANLNRLYEQAAAEDPTAPHRRLLDKLSTVLDQRAGTTPAFKDVLQARQVLLLVDEVLQAYRRHHRDLLAHLTDVELFQPFFLARVIEATLAQQGPWEERNRIVDGAVFTLNDFVGHRPVAVLENDRKLQPYPHERVRPIPVYIRGAGVGYGPYQQLIDRMLQVLRDTDESYLAESHFDLDLVDELALDPRAYDHTHPVNNRPGYSFGEWDPHHLDSQGRYRRLVLRPMILETLQHWINDQTRDKNTDTDALLWHAAVALGGTVLLASGISGDRPETHDSHSSLATIIPRIAQARDAFYLYASQRFLGSAPPPGKQPFASVRQYLNRYIARQRAMHFQQDLLAQLYARMGYGKEGRKQAAAIATPSLRIRTEIQIRLTEGRLAAKNGNVESALTTLEEIRDLLHRGIECGAIVDPWNVLGFQGNFSIFRALQDSVTDTRVDQLLLLMQEFFDLHAQFLKVAAAQGNTALQSKLEESIRDTAQWWDQFATYEVSGVRRVCGNELASSALFVAKVLALWRQSGASAGDVAFWNKHSKDFTTPKAYHLVIEALFERNDLVTTRALLMHWLSQADAVPLQEGDSSFFDLMLSWMRRCARRAATDRGSEEPQTLVATLFDYLEVNAGDYWRAPALENPAAAGQADDSSEDVFSAAYEGVTFRDSAADGQEGEIFEDTSGDDQLSYMADELKQRLAFLRMKAELEQIAASMRWSDAQKHRELCKQWAMQAADTKEQLLQLIESLHAHQIAEPMGSQDSIIEYDRQQSTKYELITMAINTAVETAHGLRFLLAVSTKRLLDKGLMPWEKSSILLYRAIRSGNVADVRERLERFLVDLAVAPLLYVPLERGGDPRVVCESRYLRGVLKQAAQELPRLGMFRETFHLLDITQKLETEQVGPGQQVTEFNILFPVGYKAVMKNLVDSLSHWPGQSDDEIVATWVSPVVAHFSKLWIEHSSGLFFGELDRIQDDKAWQRLIRFIKKYGNGLFTQSFMTFGNLRGILRRGVGDFLDQLERETDPYQPIALVEDLAESRISKREAVKQLTFILHTILENYEVYQDYNSTTTQSDYGENLYLLFEVLRVLHSYERHRWGLEPAYVAHAILAKSGRLGVASLLEQAFIEETEGMADLFVKRLKKTQERCGIFLASVEDRINERFVRPLRLNRLLALLEPAIQDAMHQRPSHSFEALRQQVEELAHTAPGAGLDPPDWLQKMEDEVDRLLSPQAEETRLELSPPGGKLLSLEDFEEQLEIWNSPLSDTDE